MNQKHNPRAGVTLIEMLVVVVIIAVFAAVVGPRLLNQGDKARVVAAKQQIENFGLALGQYHLDTGAYPSTEQGLLALVEKPSGIEVWNGPYLKGDKAPLDAWNHPYAYRAPSGRPGREYDLCSSGSAGVSGAAGIDGMICNP